jgi:hypothetical protein
LADAWALRVKNWHLTSLVPHARSLALGLKAHVGTLPVTMYTDIFKMIVRGFGQSCRSMELMGDVVYLLDTIHKRGGTVNMAALLDRSFVDPLTFVWVAAFDHVNTQMCALLAVDDLPEHITSNLVTLALRLLETKKVDFACLVLCNACFWGKEGVSAPLYKRLKELEAELHLNVDETIRSGLVKRKKPRFAGAAEACLSYPAPHNPGAVLRRGLGLARVGEKRARE